MRLGSTARRLARSLRTFAALPPGERRLFASAWWALLASSLRLRCARLVGWRWLLRRAIEGDQPTTVPGEPYEASALLSSFQGASRDHVLRVSCLPRALALRKYLTRHGMPGDLRIGLRKNAGRLEGHAWLEDNGVLLCQDESLVRTFVPAQLVAARPKEAR
jgi:hypothetical protein